MDNQFSQAQPYFPALLLALETSCDETSAALLANGNEIVAQQVASQDDLHARFGGVVPEIASRRHLEVVHPLLEEVFAAGGKKFSDVDAVAVTHGPGLIGAVLVGVAVAKTLSVALQVPLIGVNHLEGHLFSPLLENPQLEPPWISLLVSGGHTMLLHVRAWGHIEVLGKTRDDAAGEAFDKVAKMLDLGYPGGPRVAHLATQGDRRAIDFPRPILGQEFTFSFSGLKTSVHYHMKKHASSPADICASFEEAVVDVLVDKARRAVEMTGVERLSLVGGVAANQRLRQRLQEMCRQRGYQFFTPSLRYCTDNAAMIAKAGYILAQLGVRATTHLDAHASLPFRTWRKPGAQP